MAGRCHRYGRRRFHDRRDHGDDARRVATILVDSNVLIDVATQDPAWYSWSAEQLRDPADALAINPIIYGEVSVGFERIDSLERRFPPDVFRRVSLPWPAAFVAGKAFVAYRRAGGSRQSPLPDFYIGAHALVEGHVLLTRDPAPYRTYFPAVRLIAP